MKLLFAGTFREKKGIEFLIEAVAKAHHSGVNLELHLVGDTMNKVGDDETKQKLFRKIEQLGLDDVVKRYPFFVVREVARAGVGVPRLRCAKRRSQER